MKAFAKAAQVAKTGIAILMLTVLFLSGCVPENPTQSQSTQFSDFRDVVVYTLLGAPSTPAGADIMVSEIHVFDGNVDRTLFAGSNVHRTDISVSPIGDKVAYVEGVSLSTKLGGMMNYYGVPDFAHRVLTTSDGITEKAVVSCDSKIFMLPNFSLDGRYISVISTDTGFTTDSLEIYDTSGVAIRSFSISARFTAHWVTGNTILCAIENAEGHVAILEKISVETGVRVATTLTTPAYPPGSQLVHTADGDTAILRGNGGYFYYDIATGNFGAYAKLAGLSSYRVLAVKDTLALTGEVLRLVIRDLAGHAIDSLQYDGYVQEITLKDWTTKTYMVSEVGDDSQNLYEVSFAPKSVRKITNYGNNFFLVNLGHNLQ